MVCMQFGFYQTGESFWISLAQPECFARPTSLQFTLSDLTLMWDKSAAFDAAYCIDFTAWKPEKIKLRKHGYSDNSMGFSLMNFSTVPCYVRCASQFIKTVRVFLSRSHTPQNTRTHSPGNAEKLRRTQKSTLTPTPIILGEKEYWKCALRNSREEVGFSHFHPRLADVFLRESGAVQARSFHYHSEKALHETLPGKRGCS